MNAEYDMIFWFTVEGFVSTYAGYNDTSFWNGGIDYKEGDLMAGERRYRSAAFVL